VEVWVYQGKEEIPDISHHRRKARDTDRMQQKEETLR
jgi:hypothetical protein